jgi:lysophospholipase L1-like esterase
MRALHPLVLFASTLAGCASAPQTPAPSAPPAIAPTHGAVQPAPRDGRWSERHEAHVAKARAGRYRLLFLGDSITEGWLGAGKDAWHAAWAPRGALNAGIGGDRTQHVLWRLDHGLLDALASPANDVRACVVMIGTNNSNGSDHTADEIGDGIVAVVQRLRAGLPNAKVLLLAIFPRGERPDAQRAKNAAASARAFAAFAGDPMVVCRDLGPQFVAADGTLSEAVMPDALHLSAAAYATWAAAITADVDALLQ